MKILIVDDNEDSRMILRKTLEAEGYQVIDATDGQKALEIARRQPVDLIVTDILMPVMDGFLLCREIRRDELLDKIPLVFYTATYTDKQDEQMALELGADRFIRKPADPADFIHTIKSTVAEARKGRIYTGPTDVPRETDVFRRYSERLVQKLEKKMMALEEENAERRRVEERLRLSYALADQANDAYFVNEPDTGRFLDVNRKAWENLGYSREELLQKTVMDIEADLPDIDAWSRHVAQVRQLGALVLEGKQRRRDGSLLPVEVSVKTLSHQGCEYMVAVARDISRRKQAEAERERLMAAIEQAGEGVCITDPGGVIQYVNPAFETTTGYRRQEVLGQNPRIVKSGRQDAAFYRKLWETISSGKTWKGRLVNRRKDGALYTEEATISPVRDPSGRIVNYVAVKRDITEHLKLAEQFQQAQKMESVGRLAGGVAHDFNNMLGIILGYAEMALYEAGPGTPLHDRLTEIRKAAQRSADLTQQLLAYARQQTIAPKVLDLSATVEGLLKMLRRLIGENIDLAWCPGSDLWPVKMDPAQLDQILANLCVNARDAIADVGKVTIETKNVILDKFYGADHPDFLPGEFVMLAVSDNGCGMNEETLRRLFDPFFTTKEIGKGTGLGLSTVYGIVRQNGGFINVYSKPGVGTTFKIYIPRHTDNLAATGSTSAPQIPRGSGETVLLVEDEPAIRKMGQKMLERLGYTVLSAATPGDAMRMAEAHGAEIRLLMTDVVMPEMNGQELAKRLESQHPDLKCVFMSGYTSDLIAHHGVLEAGVHFVQKPFSMKELATGVWKTLHGESPEER